jgi:chemotaxis protein MotB
MKRRRRSIVAKKHNKAHDEEHIDETWLIPYADLLTLLLALFIVLFASSQVDQVKFEQLSKSLNGAFSGGISFFQPSNVVPLDDNQDLDVDRDKADNESEEISEEEILEQIEKETDDLEKLQKQLDQYILENGLVNDLETRLNHQQLMITISDSALFASGSAAVKPESQVLAVSIAAMIEQYPQYEIKIAGHTDDVPINTVEFPSNWDLSAKRALNFMTILLEHDHSDPARFSTTGYGEYRPIATNSTSEGRSENRRVEVSIMRNYTDETSLE